LPFLLAAALAVLPAWDSLAVPPPLPNLTVAGPQLNPPQPSANGQATLTAEVRNTGAADAGAFEVVVDGRIPLVPVSDGATCFVDEDSDGGYDANEAEAVYWSPAQCGPVAAAPPQSSGYLRLNASRFGTAVQAGDADVGWPTLATPSGSGLAVFGIDVDRNGAWSAGDKAYLNLGPAAGLSAGDLRLSRGPSAPPPGSIVRAGDADLTAWQGASPLSLDPPSAWKVCTCLLAAFIDVDHDGRGSPLDVLVYPGGFAVMGRAQVDGLPVGATRAVSVTWTLQGSGTWSLKVFADAANRVVESDEADNYADVDVSTESAVKGNGTALADLVVESTQFSPSPPSVGSTMLAAVVGNLGAGDAGPFDVVLLLDGVRRSTVRVAALPAGAKTQASFTSFTWAAGSHNVSVALDPLGSVDEADEDNNLWSQTVDVATTRVDGPPKPPWDALPTVALLLAAAGLTGGGALGLRRARRRRAGREAGLNARNGSSPAPPAGAPPPPLLSPPTPAPRGAGDAGPVARPLSPVPAAPIQPGQTFAGKYRIERELGKGAFGTVWLATHMALDRPVVLKQLHPELSRRDDVKLRFEREARILARLDHRNVTRIHDVEIAGGAWYLAMEYVDGGSLEDRLAAGPMPPRDAAGLVQGVLGGLAYIHAQGIVHRDLKPSNILLTRAGEPKIADFGVARSELFLSTTTGTPRGTPLYMAPEQFEGRAADARSDLYAVAATFYETVTGRLYTGITPRDFEELRKLVVEQPPWLPVPFLSGALNAWLTRGLAKRPEERFQSADEMARALGQALEASGSQA
jgi:tRNA A-37 threonylcarbamoyl transferase component Bud32